MRGVLTEDDFTDAAQQIGCQVAAIKAVCEVESPRGGFNPDGTLSTLFEAHWFHKFTNGRFAQSHPNLSSPKWDRSLYGKGWQAERARLAEAAELDSVAAIMSTSWGRFQIMGFNHGLCGFRDAADMVNSFAKGEREQLLGFVNFIIARELGDELRDLRWTPFALAYNGPRALENQYPDKLARAFAKYSAPQEEHA